MKKVVNKCRVWVNALIAAVLGMFGVTSCDVPGPVMYGVPAPRDYVEVDGEVANEEGEPLESMQVVVNALPEGEGDTLYTNASGEFEKDCVFYGKNDTLLVEVNDTTGVHKSEKVVIPFSEMTQEKVDAWVKYYSVDIKVQLKKK